MTRNRESWAHHATQPAAVDTMLTDIPRTRNTPEELRLAAACVHRHAPATARLQILKTLGLS
ncbi:hypothetical protein [Jonesia denitrificans]|uniref:Uncharacterized protein n=1 Tax=Jonesia denitrificans (strain ATCC 14870 / DSM 20603 / BCRC 15368 / CIP 55.134 / JCM 11481 / NBRC 15587 / NCTC 10816 / Prevot 55134) TaxID=471856 RepID=C7R1F2_JONDD|nr:hypothetical protein [Jonesia denitrificans]ACV09787.1 hypothetical protein Jden_2150 [Jonesia denitrificans DSM 20603]ACV09925.1 hypothetical protein Jden_2290 [Jonesia denitrificans DSM 20603]ASE08834.1 hypothetical protein CEP80_06560 [Jonesia denitrificans]ASE08891.1 hypothetical protein CEP80_06860 [Jonesia denitrificans]ASE09012.1 hypothetical protein CEP80_07585 [Jonesia denitrificans]